MDEGRHGGYWSAEQPTPAGKMMLAGWQKSAAKHMQRAAAHQQPQPTPPADDDYDMDPYGALETPQRFEADFDMDARTSSSSPAIFDSASMVSGIGAGSTSSAFADLGLTGNETDEIYCQMLLQLNRENCHLKMQLRQAHRQVQHMGVEMDQLKKEHERSRLSGQQQQEQQEQQQNHQKNHYHQKNHQQHQNHQQQCSATATDAWFAATRQHLESPGWHGGLANISFPKSSRAASMEAEQMPADRKWQQQHFAAQAHSFSDGNSNMPSPSGSMLSSAGTRSDFDQDRKVSSAEQDRKAASVPPASASAGRAGSVGAMSVAESEKSDKSSKSGKRPQHWTDEEHKRFLEAMKIFGYSSAQDIARYVGTRSVTQVRTHTQKHFLKLCK